MKKLLSYLLLSLVVAVLLLMVVSAGAQTTRIKLTQIEKANTVNGTKANQVPVSNGVGDLRYSQYVEINPTNIGYTPTATGNPVANYSQFVRPANNDIWYIDGQGQGIRLYVSASAGDYDWLEIGNNQIPNSITDSIYKYKYASVGGRVVYPRAEFLVVDSAALGLSVVSGFRVARIGLYDNDAQTWGALHHGAGSTQIQYQNGGAFSIQASGGTLENQTAPFVEHFVINSDSAVQFPLYPSTRTDAGTPTKLWGPDATGKMQNYAVSALPVTLPANVAYRDSVNTFTRNQIISNASASLIPALSLTGNWGSGFGVNTRPHLLLAPSGVTQNANWSASGTGIGLNAISGYTGRFIEFQVNGSSQFLIGASGQIYSNAPTGYSGAVLELLINASNRFAVTSNGAIFFGSNAGKSIQPIDASNTTSSSGAGIRISGGFTSEINSAQIRFGNGNGNRNPTSGTSDFININETFAAPAGSANYRPISINYTINNPGVQTGAATGLYINATETTLNGMTNNLMDLQVGSNSRFRVTNAGNLTINGQLSTGASILVATSSYLGWGGTKALMASPADGVISMSNDAVTSFNRLIFGLNTASFPAQKRNGTTIETRLADDSNFAGAQSLYNRFGSGSPEGVVTAPVGTIYNRIDGSTGTSAYIKESGTGNTGWVAIAPGGGGITGTISSGQIAVGSGANAIGGSSALTFTGNKLQINPTYTSGASGDAGVLILGTTTGSGTVGHRVVGTSISPTTVASANDQVLNAVEINAAFTNGIFTGVTNNIFAVREGGNNKFSVSSTGGASVEQLYARGNPTTVSYVANSGTSGTATRNYGGDMAFNMTFQAGGTPSVLDYIEVTFATPLPTGTKPIVTWKECSGTDLELIYKMYTSEIQKSNTKFRFYFQVAPPSTSRTFDVHVIGG